MINFTKAIHTWNKEADLITKTENRDLESYMLLEEVLEGFGAPTPKETAKEILASIKGKVDVTDVEWLDHLTDIEFIVHGSKAKMGLSPQQDNKSLGFVLEANNKKLGAGTNSAGKQLKPDNWPEVESTLNSRLQKILDDR